MGSADQQSPLLLEKNKIQSLLQNAPLPIEIFQTIASTNDYFKTANHSNSPHVCIAEMQTAGRGRFHRHWHSPFGENIYLSLCYPFRQPISSLTGLSLIIGLAVCRAIEQTCTLPHPPQIKWPNDILLNNKKLAGILIELQTQTASLSHAIIGVGLNVNMSDADQDSINQIWTSLRQITKTYYDRNVLCAYLINNLLEAIHQFEQYGLSAFLNEWEKRDALLHKTIQLVSGDQKFVGEGLGIDAQGLLQLKMSNNQILSFSSGDTSLHIKYQ